MLCIFTHIAAAELAFDEPEKGYYGPEPGTFDIAYAESWYNHKSTSRDSLGTYTEIDVDGKTRALELYSIFTLNGVRIDINGEKDGNTGYIKVIMENKGNATRVRAVFKTDVEIFVYNDKDSVTKLSDKVFYFANSWPDSMKLLYDMKSTENYIGPSKIYYGIRTKDSNIKNYYDKDGTPDYLEGDLELSYAWDWTEIPANTTLTFGFKVQFIKFPELKVTNPENSIFNSNAAIEFPQVSVDNSQSGSITVELNEQQKETTQYTSPFSGPLSFTIPNDVVYSQEERCLKMYADDSIGLKSNNHSYCFIVKNAPSIENAKFTQSSAYPGDKIQLSVTVNDKDNGKNLHLFAKAANKDAVKIKSFQSNGNLQTVKDYFTVPDLGESAKAEIKVWISDKSTSTEESDDGLYAKSNFLTAEFEYTKLPELDITYPTKKTYQRGEKIHLIGSISSTGITMKFKIDNIELQGTRSFTIDNFDFELAIPESTKFGEHTLDVIIVDSNHREVIDDDKFRFTYSNTAPVFRNVKLTQETVKAGKKAKIVGEVNDVDVGTYIVITATPQHGDKKTKLTTIMTTGDFTKFEIEVETDDSMKGKMIEIEVKATDNTAFTINDPNIKLSIIDGPIDNDDEDDEESGQKDGKGKLSKQNKMIISIVVPVVAVLIILAVIVIIVVKKRTNENNDTEGDYIKDNEV